jgi:large subunit ribosomal protein L6
VSRVGRLPISVPSGVQVNISGTNIHVKGPKGEMRRNFSPLIGISMENGQVLITRQSDRPTERALHGTTRALLANMIQGVSTGFERVLEIEGVGYRAEMNGQTLVLYMGYSHPVEMKPPAGIAFDVDQKARQVFIRGMDKEQVGQLAANIRKIRPPEPYHGKGIHYLGERIRHKAGKAGKVAK